MPENGSAVRHSERLDGIAGVEPKGEAGAHDAAERGHAQAQLQVELPNAGQLLRLRQFALLGDARRSRKHDPHHANATPIRITMPERSLSRWANCPWKIGGISVPKTAVISQRDGHAQRHSQVAHGQAEGEAAQSPQHAEKINPEKRRCGRAVQHGKQITRHQPGHHPGHDDPANHSSGQPVGLPRPAAHLPVRHVEAGRGHPPSQ